MTSPENNLTSIPHEAYCLARQPICNANSELVAYELLYRDNLNQTSANVTSAHEATARVITLAFMDIGVDKLASGLPVYINMTDELLIKKEILPEPVERVVLEVLEDIPPTPEILASLKALRAKGYTIALDDFVLNKSTRAFLPYADIIKIDILAHSQEALVKKMTLLKKLPNVTFLAEKVETWEEFEFCKNLGFDLFQGYFLSKPEVLNNSPKTDSGIIAVQLLAELHSSEPDLDQLEQLISRDPQLYYRILKYINSARYALPREITSLRHAITLLGLDQLKSVVSMVVLAGSSKRGPSLIPTALIRARMCQLIAESQGEKQSDSFFTIGLLSMLDAFFERPLKLILKDLPLHNDIKAALLEHTGTGGTVLHTVKTYEKAMWDDIDDGTANKELLAKAYIDAVIWADEISGIAKEQKSAAA